MGYTDVPPLGTPAWVVPASNLCLATDFALWSIPYLHTLRHSLATKSYGLPLLPLARKVGWQVVFTLYLPDTTLETCLFVAAFLPDLGLVYVAVAQGAREWRHAPWVAARLGPLLVVLVSASVLGNWAFIEWRLGL